MDSLFERNQIVGVLKASLKADWNFMQISCCHIRANLTTFPCTANSL